MGRGENLAKKRGRPPWNGGKFPVSEEDVLPGGRTRASRKGQSPSFFLSQSGHRGIAGILGLTGVLQSFLQMTRKEALLFPRRFPSLASRTTYPRLPEKPAILPLWLHDHLEVRPLLNFPEHLGEFLESDDLRNVRFAIDASCTHKVKAGTDVGGGGP